MLNMDLRNLDSDLSASERIEQRRSRIEDALGIDLALLMPNEETISMADEKNCENMFGHIALPVGLAGPLTIQFSNKEKKDIYLPLATTEGALVASVNRGCKALSLVGGATTTSIYHGMTRSLAFKILKDQNNRGHGRPLSKFKASLKKQEAKWKAIGESTSHHLKILSYDIDISHDHLFLTIACDTDEAMGMNMVTIAGQAIGKWIEENIDGLTFVTVAGNVDSDKKPSKRTHDRGRGYEIHAQALIPHDIIETVLKTDAKTMQEVAHAKLDIGSKLAGAVSSNLHAANIIAALYLATGQDAAHTVEGSLADTSVEISRKGLTISIRLPAILVGIRGGGTALPAQAKALEIIFKQKTKLHPCKQLAETIGAAVLAGELSLLAAQASHSLAKSHKKLAR